MSKNLSYFMREHKEEIITVPAPESFKDENGKHLEMKVKLLSNERIRKINESYKKRSLLLTVKAILTLQTEKFSSIVSEEL